MNLLARVEALAAPYLLLVHIVLWAVLALALFVTGCRHGEQAAEQKLEAMQVAQAKALAVAQQKARDVEQAQQQALALAAADTEQRIAERETRIADLERAVAAGTVRVRERFTCPIVSAPTGDAGTIGDGEERGLRADDVRFLVRFAGRCAAVQDERNLGRGYIEEVMGTAQ